MAWDHIGANENYRGSKDGRISGVKTKIDQVASKLP